MGSYITLDGTFNFRDLGGGQTMDGRRVKTGCLYRSDALHKLSDRDLEQLRAMEIHTVVDFRSPREAALQPNRLPKGVRTVVLAPHADIAVQASAAHSDDASKINKMLELAKTEEGRKYFENTDSMEAQMRHFVTEETGIRSYSALLRLLLERDAVPLVFHCRGGKDRTGWGAALILSVLGVPQEAVVADYMKTAEYNRIRNQKRMDEYRQYTDNKPVLEFLSSLMQVKESYILASLAEVDKAGGIKAYVQDVLGLSGQDIDSLKEKFLTK